LHHTNIVPVFGVGGHEGTPYYVMQFIPGLGLDGALEELRRMRGVSEARSEADENARASPPARAMTGASLAHSLITGRFESARGGDLRVGAETTVAGSDPQDRPSSAVPDSFRDALALDSRKENIAFSAPSASSLSILSDGLDAAGGSGKTNRRSYWRGVA